MTNKYMKRCATQLVIKNNCLLSDWSKLISYKIPGLVRVRRERKGIQSQMPAKSPKLVRGQNENRKFSFKYTCTIIQLLEF